MVHFLSVLYSKRSKRKNPPKENEKNQGRVNKKRSRGRQSFNSSRNFLYAIAICDSTVLMDICSSEAICCCFLPSSLFMTKMLQHRSGSFCKACSKRSSMSVSSGKLVLRISKESYFMRKVISNSLCISATASCSFTRLRK